MASHSPHPYSDASLPHHLCQSLAKRTNPRMVGIQILARQPEPISPASLLETICGEVPIAVPYSDATCRGAIKMEFRHCQVAAVAKQSIQQAVRLANKVFGTERDEQVANPRHNNRLQIGRASCRERGET